MFTILISSSCMLISKPNVLAKAMNPPLSWNSMVPKLLTTRFSTFYPLPSLLPHSQGRSHLTEGPEDVIHSPG